MPNRCICYVSPGACPAIDELVEEIEKIKRELENLKRRS